MNIIFITRCYKPTNLQQSKDNLREVFANQVEHTYVQYLLVDMSYGETEEHFKCFEDENTKVVFIYNKKDYYNNYGIDQVVNSIEDDQNTWIYVFDDDNLLNKDFINIFDEYEGEEVLVVNWNKPHCTVGNVVGKVDTCNYIVKLRVRKETPVYYEGFKSYPADGVFFENLMKKQYKIKYTTHYNVITYAALKRPLNVLNRFV